MSILIEKQGLLTSIQDNGRKGYQKFGVISSGVMDDYSATLANIAVGNNENEGVMEISLMGPSIFFEDDTIIAVTGGDLQATINTIDLPLRRPVFIPKGSLLEFGSAKSGCRAYLAVCGGFDIPIVMGSKSTYFKAKIGGFQGRALQTGDTLPIATNKKTFEKLKKILTEKIDGGICFSSWFLPPSTILEREAVVPIRVTKGQQFNIFPDDAIETFFSSSYTITPYSDRMGYRLEGEKVLLKEKFKMISEAVTFGSIQVPADGNPIILLADRQTTGGYPKIAQVAITDLTKIAQLMPGQILTFNLISFAEAENLYITRKNYYAKLKETVAFYMNKH